MDIVCGIAMTGSAGAACQLAAQLAMRLGDRLVLVHVLPPETPTAAVQPNGVAANAERDLQQRTLSLQTLGIDVCSYLLYGTPIAALTELADRLAPRLLVVGTADAATLAHDPSKNRQLAVQVAQQTHYPVLIVKAQLDQTLLSANSSLVGSRELRLLLLIDDSPLAEQALAWVRELRLRAKLALRVLYWPSRPERDAELRQQLDTPNPSGSLSLEAGAGQPTAAELSARLSHAACDLLGMGFAHAAGNSAAKPTAAVAEPILLPEPLHSGSTHVLFFPSASPPHRTELPLPELRTLIAALELAPGSHHTALSYAYALLRKRGGTVHLCFVTQDAAQIPWAQSQLAALQPSHEFRQQMAQEGYHIDTQVHVLQHHHVGQALAELATQLGADALCLATHRRSAFSQALIGSTVNEVSRHTSKPLLLVRDDLTF